MLGVWETVREPSVRCKLLCVLRKYHVRTYARPPKMVPEITLPFTAENPN